MNLKVKLIGGMLVVLIVSAVFITYGSFGSQSILEKSNVILLNTYPALEDSNKLVDIVRQTTKSILAGIDDAADKDEINDEIKSIHKNLIKFNKFIDRIKDDELEFKLKIIKKDFYEYSKAGIEELENSLKENPEEPDFEKINIFTVRLLKNIPDYRKSKKNNMTEALKSIKGKADNFKSLFNYVGFLLIFVVLFIVTVVLITIKAINELVVSAKSLTAGDLDKEIIINRSDELGILQTAFDQMRLSMSDHIKNLDEKVNEKTKEISSQMVTLQLTTDILKHSENKIRSINESAFDGIIMTDRLGAIEEFNPAAAQLFHTTEEEMLEANIHDSILSEEHAHLFSANEEGENVEPNVVNQLIEIKFSHAKEADSFWADVYITKIDSGNDIISYVYFIRDISERIKAAIIEKNLQNQLLEASRHAGKAEIATSVLHNVGNVLNSINSSASTMREILSKSRISAFQQICGMITENKNHIGAFFEEDPKGKVIPEYLPKLSEVLEEEHIQLNKEMERVTVNINHIVEIVKSQQSFAGNSNVMEELNILGVFEDSIQINKASLDRHGVEAIRHIPVDLRFVVDRHKLIQMLTNLISNAKHALQSAHVPNAKIYCSAEINDEGILVLKVKDNGIGIKKEDLKNLFTYGFTTKEEGHGFGLHSCVLAAKDMGGDMKVESDGVNQGACFIITLPPSRV